MKGEKKSHANLRGEVDVLLGVLLIPLETVVGQFVAFLGPGGFGIVGALAVISIYVSVLINMYFCIGIFLTQEIKLV